MLATPERVLNYGRTPDETIWHKPVGRLIEEFQPIACSDKGITFPPPKRDLPLNHEAPHERWCPDCLAIIRTRTPKEN